MRIYRKESMQGYWDKIEKEGPLRFVLLRGSLMGWIMGLISLRTLGTYHPGACLLLIVFWWAVGLLLGLGAWFLFLHCNKKESNRDTP